MFFPQRMKKVDIVLLKQYADAVSREVVKFGNFQIIEIEPEQAVDLSLKKTSSETIIAKHMEFDRRINFSLATFENFATTFQETLDFDKLAGEEEKSGALFMEDADLEKGIKEVENELNSYYEERESLNRRHSDIAIKIRKVNFFSNMDLDLNRFQDMKFFFSGFGIIPQTSLEGFRSAMATLPSELVRVDEIGSDVLVFFTVPKTYKEKTNNILKNVYYRDYGIPFDLEKDAKSKLFKYAFDLSACQDEELWLDRKFRKMAAKYLPVLKNLKNTIHYTVSMARLKGEMAESEKVFVFSGWVPSNKVKKLKISVEKLTENRCDFREKDADRVIEEEGLIPPTKLSNPFFLRPFEVLVNTFGTPNYRELDPTPIAALSYSVMYGAMFGDIGHGLALMAFGALFFLFKSFKPFRTFGALIMYIGLSSAFFGVLYGEIFGKETEVIFGEGLKALWMNPMHNIMTILSIAVVFGAGMLSLAILLSIFNSIREKNWGRLLFSANGLAGLSFYWSFLFFAASIVFKFTFPKWVWVFTAIGGVSIWLEKYLEYKLFHHHHGADDEKPSIALGLVEVFEASISFLSNTISFIRVGAFALNHAALMSVVFLLAGDPSKPVSHWIALFIGNLFVIGFEGFIVAIQALRLEYYEMFVKFFRADGKPFEALGARRG